MRSWSRWTTSSPTCPATGPSADGRARRAAIAAALWAAGLFGVFAGLAWATLEAGLLAALDARVAAWVQGPASQPLQALAVRVSALHAPRAIGAMTVAVTCALLWRRRACGVALLLAAVIGGAALNDALKHVFMRPRPGLGHLLGAPTDFSFPSGHVASSALLYGALVVLLWPHLRTRPRRLAVALAAATLVVLVAGSRLVLGAHRLSDVLAAPPLALGWLALCVAVGALVAPACRRCLTAAGNRWP